MMMLLLLIMIMTKEMRLSPNWRDPSSYSAKQLRPHCGTETKMPMPIIMLMMVIMSNCQPWSDNDSLTVPITVKSRQEVFHRGLLALSQFVTPEETMKRMRILMTRLYNPTFGRIWSKLNCQAQVAKIDKASLYRSTASFPPYRELSFKHGSWFHVVVKLVMNWWWRRGR